MKAGEHFKNQQKSTKICYSHRKSATTTNIDKNRRKTCIRNESQQKNTKISKHHKKSRFARKINNKHQKSINVDGKLLFTMKAPQNCKNNRKSTNNWFSHENSQEQPKYNKNNKHCRKTSANSCRLRWKQTDTPNKNNVDNARIFKSTSFACSLGLQS